MPLGGNPAADVLGGDVADEDDQPSTLKRLDLGRCVRRAGGRLPVDVSLRRRAGRRIIRLRVLADRILLPHRVVEADLRSQAPKDDHGPRLFVGRSMYVVKVIEERRRHVERRAVGHLAAIEHDAVLRARQLVDPCRVPRRAARRRGRRRTELVGIDRHRRRGDAQLRKKIATLRHLVLSLVYGSMSSRTANRTFAETASVSACS